MSLLSEQLKEAAAKRHAVTTENVLYAGKSIELTIPDHPESYHFHTQEKVRKQILDAIDNINRNISKMDDEDVRILQGLNKIVLSGLILRSGIDVETGVFCLQISEMMEWPVEFLSNNIAHDSFHVFQYRSGGKAASHSTQAEVEAVDFQLKLAPALGVSEGDQRILQKYQSDPAAIDRRRFSPVF